MQPFPKSGAAPDTNLMDTYTRGEGPRPVIFFISQVSRLL